MILMPPVHPDTLFRGRQTVAKQTSSSLMPVCFIHPLSSRAPAGFGGTIAMANNELRIALARLCIEDQHRPVQSALTGIRLSLLAGPRTTIRATAPPCHGRSECRPVLRSQMLTKSGNNLCGNALTAIKLQKIMPAGLIIVLSAVELVNLCRLRPKMPCSRMRTICT